MKKLISISILLFFLVIQLSAQNKTVKTAQELKTAVASAKPGETIFLENGEWKDADLVLQGKGAPGKPIVITPQTAGKVILTGNSSLKLSGEYLTIKNLHFKNGYSKDGDVIIFRTGSTKLANHCRLTGFVIEDFSKPERFNNDNWVVLFGKNNRVDHCTFVNKMNSGPTLIVELTDENSQQNEHSIDSNYFKGRQRLGSNGGETIRVGVSKYSLTPSRTNIKYNYFERCNGEVEVVSIKSGENQISFNTFFECEGSLVLRHGNKNIVEGNLFLGNDKPFTGGVRVINPGHRVFNNVFKDLKGTEFRSALAVMNGVPNSLINRYHQVKDADIYSNTFINCSNIEFGAGKDAERTAAPENVSFRNNLLVNPAKGVYKDNNGSGISFADNIVVNSTGNLPSGFKSGKSLQSSFNHIQIYKPVSVAGVNPKLLPLIENEATGAPWFHQPAVKAEMKSGKLLQLKSSESDKLSGLIQKSNPGDTIEFTDANGYAFNSPVVISKPVHIVSRQVNKSLLFNSSEKSIPAFFVIENGGSLTVEGLKFCGSYQNFGDVQAGIISSAALCFCIINLSINRCEFFNFNESTFSAFKAAKSTYADSLIIRNSVFRNISGTAIDLSAEKEDKGIYNAEYTVIENCLFTSILGSALNLYRGGNDESTLGPFLMINNCTFNEVDNREQGFVLRLPGVQHATITNCIFNQSGQGGRAVYFQEYAKDELLVDYCNFYQSGKVDSFYNNVTGKNNYFLKPLFSNPAKADFNLSENSPLRGKSSSSQNLGSKL